MQAGREPRRGHVCIEDAAFRPERPLLTRSEHTNETPGMAALLGGDFSDGN